MTDYITFDAQIQPMVWGDSTYTVLQLPDDVLKALGPAKRVEGEFADHPVNLAIAKAPADIISGPFLWTGKSLLDRIGLAPGDVFEARIRPADPNFVDVPSDVTNALRSAERLDAWDGLSAGKKRGLLHSVESAKRPETRIKRIQKLLAELS